MNLRQALRRISVLEAHQQKLERELYYSRRDLEDAEAEVVAAQERITRLNVELDEVENELSQLGELCDGERAS